MSSLDNGLPSDEELLRLTQLRRLGVVNAMLTPGPEHEHIDAKVAKVALSALDGIDKQILSLRRLEVDNKSADTDRQMALLLSQVANQRMREAGNPFKVAEGEVVNPTRSLAPPPEIVGEFEFQPEEMQVKRSDGNYHDFMARMDPIMAEKDA